MASDTGPSTDDEDDDEPVVDGEPDVAEDTVDDDDDDDAPSGRDSGSMTARDGGTMRDTGTPTARDSGPSADTGPSLDTGTGTAKPDAGAPTSMGGCTPAPTGTFKVKTITGTGPDGNFTMFQPDPLGEGGFKHPPVSWGNGLATTPSLYTEFLEKIASNGFVVIANPGTGSNPMVVRQGLEWLIAQGASGEYAGKLADDCAGTIGYSMGGGAAVGSGSHPAVKAVVSIHGLQDAAEKVSGPLLLTTSDDDSFVTPEGFVMPCYNRSTAKPTILAQHITGKAASFDGHLEPLGTGGADAEPGIAWLRYWLYGDQSQRDWFFGASCKVCGAGWKVQKKNHDWD